MNTHCDNYKVSQILPDTDVENNIIQSNLLDNVELNQSDSTNMVEKTCVICLEILDENKVVCVQQSKLLTAECRCEYFVHKSCFKTWIQSRPSDSINCIVCSSKGVLEMSCKDNLIIMCKSRKFRRYMLFTIRVISYICVILTVREFIILIEDIQSNYVEYRDDTT